MDLNGQEIQTGGSPSGNESAQQGARISLPGIRIEPTFCSAEVADPFDTVEWEFRSARIMGEGDQTVFEQADCEVPVDWSPRALNVVSNKYFYGELGTERREGGIRQLIYRVCRTIADWGFEDGYFAGEGDRESFYRDLTWLCLHQYAAFNSPVWFNVGLYQQYGVTGSRCNWRYDTETDQPVRPDNPYEYPQASACFIQSVADNMEDIMELARSEAMLFKFGSGTGTDMSTLRSYRERLSGGGRPSGPLSFMRVYDQIAAVVKSGGKTRRAAKMQSLQDWHPDIMEFIECKCREEEKVRILVEKGDVDPQEAYDTVPFQNANLSVRLSDAFMEAYLADEDWTTRWVTDSSQKGPIYKAREMMRRIAECTWQCGDPGVQYDTTINRWHTCPTSGRINASNPCSEYMFIDDSACNLASMNLIKFRREDGSFDAVRFQAACRIVFIAQEILVDHASYPTARIAANSHKFRPLGLGYTNLGCLLMANGLPYDSDEARGLCGAITALLHGTACLTSTELAAAAGPFDAYAENRDSILRVMDMHWEQAEKLEHAPEALGTTARNLWDEVLRQSRRHGFRNAQMTVLAPTGTISFMMDCDTTGIEPDFALVKQKVMADGGRMLLVNQTVPLALETLGYTPEEIEAILAHIKSEESIEGAPHLKAEHLAVFDCASAPKEGTRLIAWRAHIRMMAAAQPFISGAISKTVNMPRNCTVEDVIDAYVEAWRSGLKALAIYRDGTKAIQPLTIQEKKKAEVEAAQPSGSPVPKRLRLPDTRYSITHKFSVSRHEGYITVGLYPDGRPGEVFITMAKEGSTIGGLMDCFGTAISMGLQYGVPLDIFVNKFSHTRFEPLGVTKNPDIQFAKSVVDYIFRWLGLTFQQGEGSAHAPTIPGSALPAEGNGKAKTPVKVADDPETETEPAAMRDGGQRIGQGDHSTPRTTDSRFDPTLLRIDPPSDVGGPPVGPHSRLRAAVAQGGTPVRGEIQAATQTEVAPHAETSDISQSDSMTCQECGAIMHRCGTCYLCHQCGGTTGCG